MVGLLQWTAGNRLQIETKLILGLRCLCVSIPKRERTPETILYRRCRRGLKKMIAQGVERVILPEDSGLEPLVERCGLHTVSTIPLRQRLAADWVSCVLARQGKSGARIAVTAARLSGAVVQTITELALRHRYLLLELPYGGEELCRSLRREYGVSPQLNPGQGVLETAEVWLAFDPVTEPEKAACKLLRLYDETVPMPSLLLPPILEEQIPSGTCREQMLAALQEAGCLRSGQITLHRETMP